ncbi:MAG: ComEC/Rec2 family competence protein [Clostridia bacterium]|nr:ComEC/Rec2 family competence protein [Clostridia bacterium]MBQ9252197.1 ComEC/Rec2 family competence protein [Clostridia bacterium]
MTARLRGWLLPPLAVSLAGGILLGRIADSWIYGAVGLLLALEACLLLREKGRFCALLALFLALGCLRGYFGYHPELPPEGDYVISGIVAEEVEHRANQQVRTSLTRVTLDGVPLGAGAYWSFYTDTLPESLTPGVQVSFAGRVYHPSGPSNPGGYDFREELLRRGITVGTYGMGELTIQAPESFSLKGFFANLRHRWTEALIQSPLGEEAGGYAAAMLLGNRTYLPREDRTAFSRLGIAHILAVSGFHVGVLIGALGLLFRLLRLPQRVRLGLYGLILGAYVLLCGGAQPVLRASLLLLLARRGRMLARPRSLLHLLSAAWIAMLLLSPAQLTGLSFQLSFGAVLGLALVTPYLDGLLNPKNALLKRGWLGLSAGVGAQIGVLLPELTAFQELPLLGLILNVPVLAFSTVLIGLYWLALLTLPLPGVSQAVCALGQGATSALLAAVRLLGQLPGVTLWTKAPNLLSALGVVLLGWGLLQLARWSGKSRRTLTLTGAAVLVLSLIPWPHHGAEYLQFSVGDADAALLWDEGTALVMDAGYEDGVLSDYLHRQRLTPTGVILTHLHSDHVYGLQALREDHIPIRVIYLPEGAEQADIHPNVMLLLEELQAEGTEIRHLAAGDTLPLPSGEMEILWPEAGMTRPGQDANESSLVARIDIRGTTLLQTGDLDGKYEMYAAAPADVLKAPHHGSAHSSSEEFLAAVAPQAALLSTGEVERHGQYQERLGPETALFSTARQGMLILRFLDQGYTIETYLAGEEKGE